MTQAQTYDVFVYGTLLFPEVTSQLGVVSLDTSGGRVPVRRNDANLKDFQRFTVKLREHANFPAIIRGAGTVSGHLLSGVTHDSMRRLDEFEGIASGYYTRETVNVSTSEGIQSAFAYVCGPRLRDFLDGPWDPDAFKQNDLSWYLGNVVSQEG